MARVDLHLHSHYSNDGGWSSLEGEVIGLLITGHPPFLAPGPQDMPEKLRHARHVVTASSGIGPRA